MKRSPISRLVDEAARQARLALLTTDRRAQTTASSSEESGVDVGGIDDGTGDWFGFGLVDITLVGNFRAAP
jgi:hypothetical protein